MFDAIIKTSDHFEILTGAERLIFLMNSSDEAIINCVAKYIFFIYCVERKSKCMRMLSVNTPMRLLLLIVLWNDVTRPGVKGFVPDSE